MRRGYREELEKVGIKVLDVYRRKDRDTVRFLYRGRVYLAELKGFYDAMKPGELIGALLAHVEGRKPVQRG